MEHRWTSHSFGLMGQRRFTVFTDAAGVVDYVFCKPAEFDLTDVRLKEGQELVWLTEKRSVASPSPSATTRS
jgi:hypothetical protein